MTVNKRESRLRRWARKLGGCLQNHHPHRKYKSASFIDIEKKLPIPTNRTNFQRAQRNGLIGQREQPSKKATNSSPRTWDAYPKRAMPSPGRLRTNTPQDLPADETIRLVNASVNSLVARRQDTQTPSFAGRVSKQGLHESQKQRADHVVQGHPAVLTWRESFEVQRALKRNLPHTPVDKFDSAVDVTIPPLHFRKHQAQMSHYPSELGRSAVVPVQPKPLSGTRTYYPPTTHSQVAIPTTEKEPGRGEEHAWNKALQHQAGGSKATWKTASQRLLMQKKDNLRYTDAGRATMEQIESEKSQQPQMRSIQSIEEMAEEDKRADEEWNGIATQLAFDAQSLGVQEVKSVSFRHQQRPIANTRR